MERKKLKLNISKKTVFGIMFLIAVVCIGLIFISCGKDEIIKTKTNYNIVVTMQDNGNLSAKESIEYTNNSEVVLDKIILHLYPNAFREGAKLKPYDETDQNVNFKEYGNISITKTAINSSVVNSSIGGVDNNLLIIPTTLQPTSRIKIDLEWQLKIPTINHRLGKTDKTINYGNWYPIVAELENGEFRQDPYYSIGDPFFSDIADYTVDITAPKEYVIASTGKTQISTQGNNSVYHTQENNIRDFSFVASKQFDHKATSVDGVQIDYYYYNDSNSDNHMSLLEQVLKTFNNLFGQYPYDNLSVVKTGFLHGGMEYPTLVMIADNLSLDGYQQVIVHEIAHQWWYSALGNDQLNDAWLDEGLSEYSTVLFYENNPQYGHTRRSLIANTLSNFVLFAELNGYTNGRDTVMKKHLKDFKSNMEYVFMVYAKGQLFFEALRLMVGDNEFFNALKDFYKDNLHKIVNKAHIVASFEDNTKMQLVNFFDSWLDGKVVLFG